MLGYFLLRSLLQKYCRRSMTAIALTCCGERPPKSERSHQNKASASKAMRTKRPCRIYLDVSAHPIFRNLSVFNRGFHFYVIGEFPMHTSYLSLSNHIKNELKIENVEKLTCLK